MEVDEEISDPEKKTEGRRYSSFISFRDGDFYKNFVFTAAFLFHCFSNFASLQSY